MIELRVKRLHPQAQLPRSYSEQAVGLDLYACLWSAEGRPNTAILPPRTTRSISIQIAVEAPPGVFLTVCSRSGLAKKSIFVANAPGIIDPDYRGEVAVLLYNGGHETYYVKHGDRVAQLVATPIVLFSCLETDVLSETQRGENGFGSTGR